LLAAVAALDAESPDGLLVAATLAGDEEAFALLMRRYQGALLKAAISRVGRREIAEEAVQEALLCAHRWLATYDSRFSFRTWLWTILLNQCARHGKREARQSVQAGGEPVFTELAASTSPLDALLARETSERLHELLARLPEAQADALRLRFFGSLTFPEIAAAMDCSEAGAKNRVKTGLLKLALWLSRSDKQPACRTLSDERTRDGQAGSLPYEMGDLS
jgi:RNA polymerase sigma-70 factor (ECF subfamily)